MNPLVKESEYHPGHYRELTASDVRRLFGLTPNSHLPNKHVCLDYDGPRGRVFLWIAPKDHPLVNKQNNRAHRIFAVCPRCERDIPFGRMGQHFTRKDHQQPHQQPHESVA